jgi:hypothetical protein
MTIVPVFTINGEGSNVNFSIVMIFSSPDETPGIGLFDEFCKETQPEAMQVKIKRMMQNEQNTTPEDAGIIPIWNFQLNKGMYSFTGSYHSGLPPQPGCVLCSLQWPGWCRSGWFFFKIRQ